MGQKIHGQRVLQTHIDGVLWSYSLGQGHIYSTTAENQKKLAGKFLVAWASEKKRVSNPWIWCFFDHPETRELRETFRWGTLW